MRKYLTHLMAIAALTFNGAVLAVPLTFDFSGSITSVNDTTASGLVTVGDSFSGSFTYETTTPEAAYTVGDSQFAFYDHPTPLGVNGLSLSAGDFNYAASQTALLTPTVQNQGSLVSGEDAFILIQTDDSASFVQLPTVNFVQVELFLLGADGILGGSLALPTALDLSDFTLSRDFRLAALEPSGMGPGFFNVFVIEGSLLSLELSTPTTVPEPTSIALLGLGLAALGLRRKRR